MDVEEYLEHHGIKGQRWGIRHKPNPRTQRVGPVTEEFKKAHELKRRPISSLTNKELRDTNERLNLEQNFRRLNPTKVQKGHKLVKTLMSTVGLGSIAAILKSKHGRKAISDGGKFIADKAFNDPLRKALTINKHITR